MFSGKALVAWQAKRGECEEQARTRAREEIGAELDAVIAHGRQQREAETARERFSRSLRHATAVRRMGEPAPVLTPEQRAARLADIRRGVEADMDRWEADFAQQRRP